MPNSVPVRVLRTVRIAAAGTVYGREIVAGTDDQVPEDLVADLVAGGYCEPRTVEPPPPPPIGPEPVAIPDDWASGNADAVKALAAAITGAEAPRTRAEAEAIVKAERDRRAAAPAA